MVIPDISEQRVVQLITLLSG